MIFNDFKQHNNKKKSNIKLNMLVCYERFQKGQYLKMKQQFNART